MRSRGVLAGLLFAGLLACGCRTARVYLSDPTVYDRLPPDLEEPLRQARVFADAGRFQSAHDILAPLAPLAPRNLRLATFLQDVELGVLEQGGAVRGVRGDVRGAGEDRLFASYLRRAEEVPTSGGFVLAARLAPDAARALELLGRALELDRENPWAHYARAWAHAREGRFGDARKALERAFAIDPGHLPSVRLDGALLARAGDAKRAISSFESWMERSFDDPTVDPRQRATVRLDLAILLVTGGEPADALRLLDAVEPGAPERDAHVELVRAAAYQALGDPDEAQRAVRFAREASPDELFAQVDEALLAAARGDPDAEREAWKEALAIADRERARTAAGRPEPAAFRSILVQLQAMTRLARLGEPAP